MKKKSVSATCLIKHSSSNFEALSIVCFEIKFFGIKTCKITCGLSFTFARSPNHFLPKTLRITIKQYVAETI